MTNRDISQIPSNCSSICLLVYYGQDHRVGDSEAGKSGTPSSLEILENDAALWNRHFPWNLQINAKKKGKYQMSHTRELGEHLLA